MFAKRATLLCVCLGLAAGCCKVGPNFVPPHTEMPNKWAGSPDPAATQPAVTTQPADLACWWSTLNDEELSFLVRQALLTNLDLEQARSRLIQARWQRSSVVGGLFPQATGNADYARERGSAGNTTTTIVTAPGAPPTFTTSGGGPGSTHSSFQAGVDASWELDVFGGIRRNIESSDALVLAAKENIRDVQVSTAAEVALDYIQLRGFQQQIVIAKENLAAQQHTADIVVLSQQAGFVSALDVANAKAQVSTTESTIPPLEISARQEIYAIAILLGKQPEEMVDQLSPPGPVPLAPDAVPAGLPSTLLLRRPDIRSAMANLHSATALIGFEEAKLYPDFSLTGSMTWTSNTLSNWFNNTSRAWSVGPGVSVPIFQGGTLISNVRVQQAVREQAFITYRQTVLTALSDVENALVGIAKEQDHRRDLVDAVEYNRRAVDLSMKLYSAGQTDFLNVLNAQRSLFAVETSLVQSNANLATDLVSLYKALGGGWEDQPLEAGDLPPCQPVSFDGTCQPASAPASQPAAE